MAVTTDAREELAALLVAALDPSVYVYTNPPTSPDTPSVSITAGSPWMTPERLGGPLSLKVSWKLVCAVLDTVDYVAPLEQLIEDVLTALDPDLFVIDKVSSPVVVETANAQSLILTADVTVTARITA